MVLKITNLHILRYLPTYWLYLLERYTIDNQQCTHAASNNLYIGTRYMYNNSTQINLPANNQILTNEIYSYAGVSGLWGDKFSYSISAGINNNIFTTIENETYKFIYFRPQIKLGYFIDQSSELALNYEVNTENPAVSSLTYNPYYKDPNYIFTGNPNLQPCNSHTYCCPTSKELKNLLLTLKLAIRTQKTALLRSLNLTIQILLKHLEI